MMIELASALVLCTIMSIAADECAESAVSTCRAVETGIRSVVIADYAPHRSNDMDDAEEQEEDNDADLILHMQMKLTVDLPPPEHAGSQVVETSRQGHLPAGRQQVSDTHHSLQQGKAREALTSPKLALETIVAQHAASEAPQSNVTGIGAYVFLGLVIGALLTIGFFLFDKHVRLHFKEHRARLFAEQRAAAKSKMNAFILDNFLPKSFTAQEDESRKKGVLTLLENVSQDKVITLEALTINTTADHATKAEDVCQKKDVVEDVAHREDEEEPEAETNLGKDSNPALYLAEQVPSMAVPCCTKQETHPDVIIPDKVCCDAIC